MAKLSADEQRAVQFEQDWVRFLVHAKSVLGSHWWVANWAVRVLDPRLLPWQVQNRLVERDEGFVGAARSLGKLLAARRGWRGELFLESKGDGKEALQWRLMTLDQMLEL